MVGDTTQSGEFQVEKKKRKKDKCCTHIHSELSDCTETLKDKTNHATTGASSVRCHRAHQDEDVCTSARVGVEETDECYLHGPDTDSGRLVCSRSQSEASSHYQKPAPSHTHFQRVEATQWAIQF